MNILFRFKSLFGIACVSCLLILSSCSDDDSGSPASCDAVTCLNGGTCVDGTCDCPEGFEGETCETEILAKFLGTYHGQITILGQTYESSMTVYRDENDSQKLWTDDFYAVVSGTTSLDIPSQNYTVLGNTTTISGSGSLSGNTITFDYQSTFQGDTQNYHFTGTK